MEGPSFRRKKRLSTANERANASDVMPRMPSITPFTSDERIFGASCSRLDFALEVPDLSTPASFNQPSTLFVASVAYVEIDERCELMPPIPITTTKTATAA